MCNKPISSKDMFDWAINGRTGIIEYACGVCATKNPIWAINLEAEKFSPNDLLLRAINWGEPRDDIVKFSKAMETKLLRDDEKKGVDGWRKADHMTLLKHLIDEVMELKDAIDNGTPYDVYFEAADIANFAMMIAENSLTSNSNMKGEDDG